MTFEAIWTKLPGQSRFFAVQKDLFEGFRTKTDDNVRNDHFGQCTINKK